MDSGDRIPQNSAYLLHPPGFSFQEKTFFSWASTQNCFISKKNNNNNLLNMSSGHVSALLVQLETRARVCNHRHVQKFLISGRNGATNDQDFQCVQLSCHPLCRARSGVRSYRRDIGPLQFLPPRFQSLRSAFVEQQSEFLTACSF